MDVFAEQSYTFQMKLKILECMYMVDNLGNLADVKEKIHKYSVEDGGAHREYY